MKINQYNNKQNFRSINVVQIKKTAFKNPEDVAKIEAGVTEMFEIITEGSKGKVAGFLGNIKFLKKKPKIFSYLEQPRYVEILENLKKSGGYSLNWLSQNKKVSVREPINEAYHSFFVYTDRHKDICLDIDEKVNKFAKNPKNAPINLNQFFIRQLAEAIGNDEIKYYRIEQLNQIPKVFEEIGV